MEIGQTRFPRIHLEFQWICCDFSQFFVLFWSRKKREIYQFLNFQCDICESNLSSSEVRLCFVRDGVPRAGRGRG